MKRFKNGLVSIMAAVCVMVAFASYDASAAETVGRISDYQGISQDSGRWVNAGWRPNITKFERTERAEPVRGSRTQEQERLWRAYDGYIGARVRETVNVYRGLAEETTAGPGGQNQKAAGSVITTDLPYVEKNGHLNSNIVVMFSATWCGPCKRMYPVMKQLRKEGYIVYVYTLDTQEFKNLDLGSKFQIRAYPTFIFFDKGKEVKRIVGGTSIDWFRKNLKLESEQDAEKEDSNPYDGI